MFAPYQADPPEASRSPDTASPRTSLERRPWSPLGGSYSYQKRTNQASPPPLQHPQPQRSWQTPGYQIPSPSYQQSPAPGGGGVAANNKNYHNAVAAAGAANPAPTRPSLGGDGYFGNISSGFAGATDREGINEFDTSLGIRLDYEACLAYLALPPLGAIVLLILERKSDYVRFHAWQSALLFTVIFIFHIVFSWSTFFGWLFFLCDLALIALLTMRAYRDADMLDRYEVPFFGHIASRFLDDE